MTAATVAMAAPWDGWPASGGLGGQVFGVALDREVDVHADRAPPFLSQLAEQPGGPGQQGESPQQVGRKPEIGEGGTAGARAVEGQGPAEHLRVDPADRLEQA